MSKLGTVTVGKTSPIRIMGILNTSPESFYKKSIKTTDHDIAKTIRRMDEQGADIVDIGGMSTAPYLSTLISERTESQRISQAIKIVQRVSNLPISVDTCRASVAKNALELGVDIINDISGLKFDKEMPNVIEKYQPSVIVCAFSKKQVSGNNLLQTKKLITDSIKIAKSSGIKNIVVDPAIGFFRTSGRGLFFTKFNSDWVKRDLGILSNLSKVKTNFPVLVSVSNKSFLGKILQKPNPDDRLAGSLACEVMSAIKGADVIRTHNVKYTKEVIHPIQRLLRTNKSL